MKRILLPLCLFVAAAFAIPPAYASSIVGPTVSDRRPYSFTVSWVTATPSNPHVDVLINGKWQRIHDVRGVVHTTTHYFAIPCDPSARSCKANLTPNTLYTVRAYGLGKSPVTLRARTTPLLRPAIPQSAVGSHVVDASKHPIANALVYVVVHHGSQASVPLAVLTIANGGWIVSLDNAVTTDGKQFPISTGDWVSISVYCGRLHASTRTTIRGMNQAILLGNLILR